MAARDKEVGLASSQSDPVGPDRVVITAALTGVLTDPKRHPVPVTPEELADEAARARDVGAAIVHVHFRDQRPGCGHLPSWDADVAASIVQAIRARCPELLINMSTGVVGEDVSGPLACLERTRPELAALNAGSLNYLKLRRDGRWAWEPLLFANPVSKIERLVRAMDRLGVVPECECFDTGIVRSVALFERAGMLSAPVRVSFVMGVASGMPADRRWLPLLIELLPRGAFWQLIAIGREEIWPLQRRAAELGGALRTGLEDTFYLPDGTRARSNGELVEALVRIARESGREPAEPAQVRTQLALQRSALDDVASPRRA